MREPRFRPKFCTIGLLAAAVAFAGPVQAQEEGAVTEGPVSMGGREDAGSFTVYKNEEPIITMEFTWASDGTYEGVSTIQIAGQKAEFKLHIEPGDDGRWHRIMYSSPVADVFATRDGAKCQYQGKDKSNGKAHSQSFDLQPAHVLFENFSPALMALALDTYDVEKGGEQTLTTLVIPYDSVESKLTYLETVERRVGEGMRAFRRFKYEFAGSEIFPWADETGRIYMAEVPAQHVTYVRDGFEALLQRAAADPLLSAADHEIVEERGVRMPMRDGVELATDIYRPEGDGKVPVVHIRTPYKKEMLEMEGRFWARRGYAAAIQDVRGRFASAGEWEPFVHEARDGFDSIEWLAARPWCNGKVGMIGGSYLGWVQWLAASTNPPHLACMIPNVSPPDPFFNIPYEYGTFFLQGAIWWAEVVETEATADISGLTIAKIGDREYAKLLRTLPVIDLDEKILGKRNRYWRNWIEHPTRDEYWESACHLDKLAKVRIPVFHQSGWFDGDGIGTKLNYLAMAEHGHPFQKLVLGPWGHTDTAARKFGGIDFGPRAIIDLQAEYLRWFDHWLKGVDNGIDREPLVSLFVMGETNDWVYGNTYPLESTRFEKWFLSSSGHANTSKGNGSLSRAAPAAESAADVFVYDPADPTPAPIAFAEDPTTENLEGEERRAAEKAYHGKVLDKRTDILVYTSDAFEEPYTFAGPLSATLYASTSAKDTDWFVSLDEVTPDGEMHSLGSGRLRARYRNGMRKTELVEPGAVIEYSLDLWHSAATLAKGSRLRVEVASAYFPLFSRNLNTGENNETGTEFVPATQAILHDEAHPSHVLLPVVPVEAGKKSGQ